MTDEEKHYGRELGRIGMWLDGFGKKDTDNVYLCFLRMLADFRRLQAQELDVAIEEEEKQNK